MPAAPLPAPASDRLARLLVLSGLLACIAGVVAYRLWDDVAVARVAELLAIAGIATLLAWPLVRGRRLPWATALAFVWTAALVALAGPVPVLVAGVLALGAIAAGSLFVEGRAPAQAFVLGAGLLAGLVGWLLPLPVHRAFVYLPCLVVLIAWRRDAVRAQFASVRTDWIAAVAAHPALAACAVAALGVASTGSWLPTLQYDDLAYHVGLPWQLMEHGRHALDPTHQVWALAPWSGDVLHGIAQVVARSEARGPLNAVWLVAISMLLWRLSRQIGLELRACWLVLVLAGTLPLLAVLLAGMQTELPATAVTLLLATLAVDATPTRRTLPAAAVAVGMLFGLKLIHPVAACAIILLLGWRLRRSPLRTPAGMAAAAAFGLLAGGSSYAYAQAVAGNPVLPLLNGTFRSPYFAPVDFIDPRWTGDGLLAPWYLAFETSRYLEGWDGGFGLVHIALAGAALAALRDVRLRGLAVAALAAFLLPLILVPYARYAFVGLVLMLPVAVAGLGSAFGWRIVVLIAAGVAATNVAMQPNANWLQHTGAAKRSLLAAGRDGPLMARYAPERVIHQHLRQTRPDARVLDLHGASHAELAGRGRTVTWYAPALHAAAARAQADPSGRAWMRLLAAERVSEVVHRPALLTPAEAAGLRLIGAYHVLTVGAVQWWTIPSTDAR